MITLSKNIRRSPKEKSFKGKTSTHSGMGIQAQEIYKNKGDLQKQGTYKRAQSKARI